MAEIPLQVMRKILVTGGCGFIGSNFIRLILAERPDAELVNVDLLTYAGNPANLADLVNSPTGARYCHEQVDIADAAAIGRIMQERGPFDAVVNFAAESHVDRSIDDPSNFLHTNVAGTLVLLQAFRSQPDGARRFLQVSTDEVYGSLGAEGLFREDTPLAPNSPYSASKASADFLVRSFVHTYGLDGIITRCSNNYGPYQYPEKLIPLMITRAMADEPLPVYGDGKNVRDWIHVEDHCRGLLEVLERGQRGEIYNLGGQSERQNLDVVRGILRALNKPDSLIQFVTDRPGHDRRYAVDITKIGRDLGWQPRINFEQGLEKTVQWYRDHPEWWRPLIS